MNKFSILFVFLLAVTYSFSQDQPIAPSNVTTAIYHGETPPLRDIPPMTDAEWEIMAEEALKKVLNPKPRYREYPYAESALPKGPDPVWQKDMPASRESRAPILNINGQSSPYYPPDANGTAGPNHYMQTINTVYAIYNKSGTLVAGPTALNTLFTGVTGSNCNNGDPIVLYDEQADRWLVAEFSICGANDYMLVAVSTTNDPTGTWHKYSFDVDDVPDYEKLGIWQDGYYMGTNTDSGNDIYVMERAQMLVGGTAQMVAFDNPWRPKTDFICVPPVDNDGAFAPAGSPGIFIAAYDDAWGGGADQLWIYELTVNWTTPASSTFTRTQQINVAPFDSNFGASWDNITQPGTTQKLDAILEMIMNPPQYRNFGAYQTIVCCHTVDVDGTDHAGIRWYELRRTGSTWSIRQQGTYAPDEHSRWLGSIMLNGHDQVALAYSISSASVFPGIRYCAQDDNEYANATGIMNIAETVIQNGAYSQTATNRWGDYAGLQIDPVNDSTFWFTSQYIGSGGARLTRIASFNIGPDLLTALFSSNKEVTPVNTTVTLTDQSIGGPTGWSWSIAPSTYVFVNGTDANSQNPQVQFTSTAYYTVSLTVSDGITTDTEIKPGLILAYDCDHVQFPYSQQFTDGVAPYCWTVTDNQGNGQVWTFNNPGNRTIGTSSSGNGFAILDSDYYGTGNSQNSDLVSPLLDFSGFATVNLAFQHYFRSYSGSSGTLSYSTNGGANWTTLQTWTASTGNPAIFSQNLSSQLAGQANVKLRWRYVGTWGWYWAVDDLIITATAPGRWTGNVSADWSNPSNWSNNEVPAGADNITIPPFARNWPVYNGNLTIGNQCGNITLEGDSQLTVTGSLTVNPGKSLIIKDNGVVNQMNGN